MAQPEPFASRRSSRRPIWLATLAAALALTSLLGCAIEHTTQAPEDEASASGDALVVPDGAQRLSHLQVHMRDGVRLDTDVLLPAGEGRHPTVLVRTPYRDELGHQASLVRTLLEQGYAVVQQHERGRYLSEGQVRMLSYAAPDGWDTLDWIVAQPWSDGQVATMGCSSSAENQLKLAALNHPAHKAMIPWSAGVAVAEIGPFHEQGNFWLGGVWQQGWFNYFIGETQRNWPQLPAGLSDTERRRASETFPVDNDGRWNRIDYRATRLHLPMIELAEAVDATQTDFEDYLRRGPVHPDWSVDRVTPDDHIHVPGLWAEALYDISARSTVAYWDKTRAENPAGSQTMLVTNGGHCSFGYQTGDDRIGDRPLGDMRVDADARRLAWLDHWLKGKPLPPELSGDPLTVYMAGANRWARYPSLPAADAPRRTLWLDSAGHANTLDGDGRLLDAPPGRTATDGYDYDPANPVIAHGGAISGVGSDEEDTDGSFDQRPIEARPDVLVYTSAPLNADLPVFGYVDAELYVASSAPDTDFTAKLVDVAPDGTAWNLADTIQRMRYRDGNDRPSLLTPGDTYRVSPPPMLVANVFQKGHRVRIEVSSSLFPNYARNLNTAGDPYTTSEFQVARNSVLHGGEFPARIRLPLGR